MSALGQVPTFFLLLSARGVVQLKCYILSYRTSPSTASSMNSIEETSFRHTQLSFTHELLSRAFLYRHLLRSCLAPSAYFHALSRSKLRNCSNLSLTNTCWERWGVSVEMGESRLLGTTHLSFTLSQNGKIECFEFMWISDFAGHHRDIEKWSHIRSFNAISSSLVFCVCLF